MKTTLKQRLSMKKYKERNFEKIKELRRNYYLKNRDKILNKNKEYLSTVKGKQVDVEAKKKYRMSLKGKISERKVYINFKLNNPAKYKARYILRNAVTSNKIRREPCLICGKLPTQAHHSNYKKPLEVQWLCGLHHNNIHGKML